MNRFRISELAGDACERIEWIAGLRRKKKQKDDVHRLTVDCIKVDGMLETNQSAERFFQARYPRMRNSDAASPPRGSQALALEQLKRNEAGIQIKGRGCPRGQLLQ